MAATVYASIEDLAQRVDPTGAWDTADKAVAGACLRAASTAVEQYTGRRFAKDNADATRYFTADSPTVLWADDIVSITTLTTDVGGNRDYTDTWTTSDYDLEPYNAAADNEPYTHLRVTPTGDYSFPVHLRKGVKIVGRFGWPEVPQPVTEVVLLEAARMLQQTQSPSGVVANMELGRFLVIPQLHPTSRMLLAPFRRMTVVAV